MNAPFMVVLLLAACSLLFTTALIYQYLVVTRKRRGFIAQLGGSGRAVPKYKHTLLTAYVVSSVFWSVGIIIFYLLFIQ